MENSALESGIMTQQRHGQNLANHASLWFQHLRQRIGDCRFRNLSNVVVMKRPLTPLKVSGRQLARRMKGRNSSLVSLAGTGDANEAEEKHALASRSSSERSVQA